MNTDFSPKKLLETLVMKEMELLNSNSNLKDKAKMLEKSSKLFIENLNNEMLFSGLKFVKDISEQTHEMYSDQRIFYKCPIPYVRTVLVIFKISDKNEKIIVKITTRSGKQKKVTTQSIVKKLKKDLALYKTITAK